MSSYTPMELAEVFIKTGELDDALSALNQQLDDKPEDNNARRLRASVLLRLKKADNLQMALDDYQYLSELSVDDYVQQSVIYERMGQTGKAIQAMQTAHQADPDAERILERLVELMTNNKQYAEVLELIENAPQTWRWQMRQADIYALLDKPTEALKALNRAQTHLQVMFPELLSPVSRNTMARIHMARGTAHMKLNDLKAAETEFKDALFHIPNDATIMFNIGLIYARKGSLSLAERNCKKALGIASEYIRQTLIDVLNNDDRYAELKKRLKL